MVHIYHGILLSRKKNEIMPFATTWMDLEIIILNEISQWKTNIIWYVEYKRRIQMNLFENRNRLPDFENKLMVTKGDRGRWGVYLEFGIDICRRWYMEWLADGDLMYSTELYPIFCDGLHGKRIWKRMHACTCVN